jgi:hypothetical protein
MGLVMCLYLQGWQVEAETKLPLSRIVKWVDRLDPRAIPIIEEHLNGSHLRPRDRARLLQLKSLYQIQKLRTIEAKALYIRALEIDENVGLLGEMTDPTRRQYEAWRQQFLAKRAANRPNPPKKNESPFANKPLFRIVYGVFFGLGAAALIVGGIGSGLAVQHTDAYNGFLATPPSPEKTKQLIAANRQAQEMQTLGVIGWAGGGAFIAVGIVLAVVVESTPSAPAVSVENTPPVGRNGTLVLWLDEGYTWMRK